jgi:hypothetical protein
MGTAKFPFLFLIRNSGIIGRRHERISVNETVSSVDRLGLT